MIEWLRWNRCRKPFQGRQRCEKNINFQYFNDSITEHNLWKVMYLFTFIMYISWIINSILPSTLYTTCRQHRKIDLPLNFINFDKVHCSAEPVCVSDD